MYSRQEPNKRQRVIRESSQSQPYDWTNAGVVPLWFRPPTLDTLSKLKACVSSTTTAYRKGNRCTPRVQTQLKECVQHSLGEPSPFLRLPHEIRDLIYDYTVPNMEELIVNVQQAAHYFLQGARHLNMGKHQHRLTQLLEEICDRYGYGQTPTIFLLNSQIHNEAMLRLQKGTLVMDRVCINDPNMFPFVDMISTMVIRNVRKIHFVLTVTEHERRSLQRQRWFGYNWCTEARDGAGGMSLDESDYWATMIKHFMLQLLEPGFFVKTITFSIKYATHQRDYDLPASDRMAWWIGCAIDMCLKNERLDSWLGFLEKMENNEACAKRL